MDYPVKNILIYRLGSLGDTVIALPCFHKIREVYPHATITLLTNRPVASKAPPLESVLGSNYFFNHTIDYPIGTRNPLVLANLLKQIRSLHIDTLINLTENRTEFASSRDIFFFRLCGIKTFLGFPEMKKDFEVCIDYETGLYEWEAKRLVRRIATLGEIDLQSASYWDLKLTDAEVTAAKAILKGVPKPIFAISTGTKFQTNDWGQDNWLSLISQLRPLLSKWTLIMIGSQEDAHFANSCVKLWGEGLNLCGKTSPRLSAAILKHTELFIGHDSGPMHLAACVGIQCVGIFSARNRPGQWYPRGNFNQIIYHQTECAGCGLENCINQKKKCILSITVEEVQQAITKIVGNSRLGDCSIT